MPRKTSTQDPDKLKELGNKCFLQGRYTEAVQNYTKAINIDDTNHIYFANRANAYLRTEEWSLALEDSEKSIELNKEYGKSWYRKAKALLFAGKLQDGLKAIEEGLSVSKDAGANQDLEGLKLVTERLCDLSTCVPEDHPNKKAFNKFLPAYVERGFVLNKAGVVWENPYWKYLYATQDIEAGTVLLEVPAKLILRLETLIPTDPLLNTMNDEPKLTMVLSTPWRSVFFAIFLHLERQKKSEEYGWLLDEMEPDISTIPRFYDEKDQDHCKGSSMLLQQEIIKFEATRDHLCLTELVDDAKGRITPEELLELKYFTRRTGFPIQYEGGAMHPCHVPLGYLVSMTNDQDCVNARWEQKPGEFLRLIAKRDIPFGEAIRQQGQINPCNFDILNNFGNLKGLPEDNPYNTTMFQIGITREDPQWQAKLGLLGVSPDVIPKVRTLPSMDLRAQSAMDGRDLYRIMSWLRITENKGDINDLNRAKSLVNNQALAEWKQKGKGTDEEFQKQHKFTGQELGPVNADCEIQALTKFVELINRNLQGLLDTEEADKALLESEQGKIEKYQDIVRVKRGEKKVLEELLKQASFFLEIMQDESVSEQKIEQLILQDMKDLGIFNTALNYMKGVIKPLVIMRQRQKDKAKHQEQEAVEPEKKETS